MPVKRSEFSLPPKLGSTPWLVSSHGRRMRNQTFFNLLDGSLHHRSIPEMRNRTWFGYSHGYMMMQDNSSKECFLQSLDSMEVIPLPRLSINSRSFSCFRLSTAPENTGCVAVLVFLEQIMCHRLHDVHETKWKTVDVDADGCSFTGGIASLEGGGQSLYVHCHNDVLIAINTSSPDIEAHRMDVARIDELADTSHYEKTFFECGGELFVVILYFQWCFGACVNAEVHKLDLSELEWERVDSIGSDRAFFVGSKGFAYVVSNAAGVKGDCIYFTQLWYDGMRLYRFRLDERSFSHKLICPNLPVDWDRSCVF